jgi:uncharacterized protein CbrC (UPF0167 family)
MVKKAAVVKPLPAALLPQGKMPPLSTFSEHPWFWLLKHRVFYKFRRGKLRCPCCGTVGTWKPYGLYWRDREVRRWLCKWCGFYDGTDGRFWCGADKTQGCWVKREKQEQTTPEEIMREAGLNPWAG